MKAMHIVLLALSTAAFSNLAVAGQAYQDQVIFNDGSQLMVDFTFDSSTDSVSNITGLILSPGITPPMQTIGANDISIFHDFGSSAVFTAGGNTYLQVDWFSSQAQIAAGTYTYDVADVFLLSNGNLSYANASDPLGLQAKLYSDGNSSGYQATILTTSQEFLTSSAVPLPSALALLGAGLPGLLGFGVSRRKMPQA